MAGMRPVSNGGPTESGDGRGGTTERRPQHNPSAATQSAPFAPGGIAPPSWQPVGPTPDAPRRFKVRIGTQAAPVPESDAESQAAPVPESDEEYLARCRYSPAALEHLAAVAGGPPTLTRLRSLDATWTFYDRAPVDRLLRAVNRLGEAQPENEQDARAQTVKTLLKLYEPLTQWGFADADLLEIVGWLGRSDPSRSEALHTLDANREWLQQRDYLPTDMRRLAERPDFSDILDAIQEHDAPLRAAKFRSFHIAEAARNEAGARSIAALAEHQEWLIDTLEYTPSQLSRFADLYGPALIELLAERPELTTESGGPLGVAELISEFDNGEDGRTVEALRAFAIHCTRS